MKKNATTIFEKLDGQNFKIVNNTENIAGGEFHHHHPRTFRKELVRTSNHHHFGRFDHEFKIIED